MNPEEIRRQLAALGTELDELRQLDSLNAEQDARVDEIVNEINQLGDKLVRAMNVEAASRSAGEAAEFVSRDSQSRGRVSGVQPIDQRAANPENRGQQRERRSLGERVFESDEFRALQQRGGEGVASFQLESFHSERMQQRALAHTGILPADYLEPMRIPGIQRPDDTFGSLRDVLTVGQTGADSLIYFRETAFTNNAAVVPEATHTAPGDETPANASVKPESAITFEQKTSEVVTIAHWIPITRQMIWNAPEMRTYIEGRLVDGLKLKEDDDLLNGDGSSGSMTGLLETSDIQVLDDTYFAANPVNDDGTGNEPFNRILRARTRIATVGRARANFVVLNPVDHEAFMVTTDAQRQYFGAGPFAAGNVAGLWGMRVVINENIAAGTALVGDGRQATIWDRMQAQVLVGTIDKQFIRNMLTLLAEERIGLTVFRPQAFAEVDLGVAA